MTNKLVVFDLDETLLNGDSMALWHQFLVDKGLAPSPEFLEQDACFMAAYTDGSLNLDDYLAFTLSPFKNIQSQAVDALAAQFALERALDRIFPEAIMMLDKLREEETALAIVSASLGFLVHPIARALGVETSMAVDLKQHEGFYLPIPEGIPTFREGKVLRLIHWIATLHHDFDHISFYTDSINDLPMCFFADTVQVVNPCPKLFKKAGEYNWPVLRWGCHQ